MAILNLRYRGNGATRGQIVPRSYDGGEVSKMDPVQVEGMISSGLWVAETDDVPEETVEATVADGLEDLTKAQLVALADERGVEVDPKAKNAVLIAALREAAHAEAEG